MKLLGESRSCVAESGLFLDVQAKIWESAPENSLVRTWPRLLSMQQLLGDQGRGALK